MENDENKAPSKLKKFMKGALKWTFRFAVIGIGFGIGSEIITELISYAYAHGTPEGMFITGLAKDFFMPFFSWMGLTGWEEETYAAVGDWAKNFTEAVHNFFGFETVAEEGTSYATEAVVPSGGEAPTHPSDIDFDPFLDEREVLQGSCQHNDYLAYENQEAPGMAV